MSREIRSRRAGLSRAESRTRPLYARLLGLQYLRPGGVLCFVYFEGSIALAVLLGLAELVSWWAVLVLPMAVAVMVKLNDVVAGSVAGPPTRSPIADARTSTAGARTSTLGGQASTVGGQASTAGGATSVAGQQRSAAADVPATGPDATAAWSPGQHATALAGSLPAGSLPVGAGATPSTAVPAQGRPGAVDTVETAPGDLSSRVRTPPRAEPAWWQTVQPAATAPPVESWYPDAAPELTTGPAVRTAPAHGQPDGRRAGDPGDPFDPREQRARQSGSRRYE